MRRSTASGLGLSLLAAIALAACGGTDSTGLGNTDCKMTVSGAPAAYASMNGTFDCVVVAIYATAANQGGVTIAVTTPAVNGAACFPGEVTETTYNRTDAGAACGMSASSGTAVWSLVPGPGGTGSYALHLTDVNTITTNTGVGKAYSVDGTLDATLLPAAGTPATGNITLHAVF